MTETNRMLTQFQYRIYRSCAALALALVATTPPMVLADEYPNRAMYHHAQLRVLRHGQRRAQTIRTAWSGPRSTSVCREFAGGRRRARHGSAGTCAEGGLHDRARQFEPCDFPAHVQEPQIRFSEGHYPHLHRGNRAHFAGCAQRLRRQQRGAIDRPGQAEAWRFGHGVVRQWHGLALGRRAHAEHGGGSN